MPTIEPLRAEARPFWSVMIPCYNSAALLSATIESVLAQDPGPDLMQIEVIDDASTLDDPGEVVRRVAGSRVGYFRHPIRVGASANFTTCIRRSLGHWVHILHSDDLVRPGFYDRYRERIEACPDVLMVGARTVFVDAEVRDLGLAEPVVTDRGYLQDPVFTLAVVRPLQFVSVVVVRLTYEQVGGFHPGLIHANDWEMWTRVASHGPVGWVDESLGLYRIHGDSDTNRMHRSTAYVDDCLKAADAVAARFDYPARFWIRHAARKSVCEYALHVGSTLLERGELRLVAANAVRAVRIDQSPEVLARAWDLMRRAVNKRIGR